MSNIMVATRGSCIAYHFNVFIFTASCIALISFPLRILLPVVFSFVFFLSFWHRLSLLLFDLCVLITSFVSSHIIYYLKCANKLWQVHSFGIFYCYILLLHRWNHAYKCIYNNFKLEKRSRSRFHIKNT